MLNLDATYFENSADPDQMSFKPGWSVSTLLSTWVEPF